MWRGLQAGRFIEKAWIIGGMDYNYWRDNLKDLSDRHLMAGYRHSGSFRGFFTWGAFRHLCIEGVNIETEQSRRLPNPTIHRLSDLATKTESPRFRELMKVTEAMQEEEGEGPITRATEDGFLTGRFVKGKSAEEIISYCERKYGA